MIVIHTFVLDAIDIEINNDDSICEIILTKEEMHLFIDQIYYDDRSDNWNPPMYRGVKITVEKVPAIEDRSDIT